MKKRINIGLIGTGRLGYLYAEILRTQIPQANLVAVAGHRAAEIADDWSIGIHSPDREAIINHPLVEAVVIVSSTDTHIPFLEEAVTAKKPTFCEKPLALSTSGLVALGNRIQHSGVYVQIGFMRRYDPAIAAMKQRFAAGEVGSEVLFKSTSRDQCAPSVRYCSTSGGLLLDMGIHDFDLARYFFGEVETVRAVGATIVFDELNDIGDIDNAICTLEFKSGALGVIDVSRCAYYGYDVHTEVLGSHGMLRAGYYQQTAVTKFDQNEISHDVVQAFGPRYNEAFRLQLTDYVNRVIAGDEPSPCTFKDGYKALEIAEAANRSLKNGLKAIV